MFDIVVDNLCYYNLFRVRVLPQYTFRTDRQMVWATGLHQYAYILFYW